MRNPLRTRLVVLLAVLGTAVALLTGCSTTRSKFVSNANDQCVKYQQRLDAKAPPKTTRHGIDYALNYYTDLDLAVSALNTMALPSADAKQIRDRWFKPAQRSLAAFRTNLETIRKASMDGNSGLVDQQLSLLQHVGSQGVDAHYLESLGVSRCIPLFGTPT
jgi:uncharacterized protein YceK